MGPDVECEACFVPSAEQVSALSSLGTIPGFITFDYENYFAPPYNVPRYLPNLPPLQAPPPPPPRPLPPCTYPLQPPQSQQRQTQTTSQQPQGILGSPPYPLNY